MKQYTDVTEITFVKINVKHEMNKTIVNTVEIHNIVKFGPP